MFKLPLHQVAGHQGSEGKLGPLVDDSGRFYKPLQSKTRGSNELAFYKSLFSNTIIIPDHIRRFFATFHGTQLLRATDGSGLHSHIILEDLVFSCRNPTIMDVKIGSRTWPLESSADYITKCSKRDRESTSFPLGFRVSGLQIYGYEENKYWKPEIKLVKKYSTDDVKLVLRRFVSSNVSDDLSLEPDCAFGSSVYGGLNGILAQLLELKSWFEDQTIVHFHSSSLLFIFEKELLQKGVIISNVQVKLIDFAHVVDARGVIDHNFLGGLCSLIQLISETLTSSNQH